MKKYELIASTIRNDIISGRYPDGMLLPTEEALTCEHDVSRQTVRKALSMLVDEGLIIKRQGSGSSVRRRFSGQRSGIIAVIATYIDDYIFPGQLRAVEEVLSRNKYSATISATKNRVCNERAILEEILRSPVDGLLIEGTKTAMPNPNHDLYERLLNKNIPFIFFNSYYPDLTGSLSVCADNIGGGSSLAEYLVSRGHTNVAGFFKSDDIQGHQRYSGFINAMYDKGIIVPDEQMIWYTTETEDRLFSESQDILGIIGGATAIICYNDKVAFRLIKYLISKGKRVPEDIAVVSFDNSNLSTLSSVTITSLSYGENNIGSIAAQKLVDLLNGKKVASETVPWVFTQKESS